MFVKLMKDYRLRDLFKPSMADLSLCFYIFEKFLEVHDVCAWFDFRPRGSLEIEANDS